MKFELFAIRVKTTVWPTGEEYPEGEWLEPSRLGCEFSDARLPPDVRSQLFHDEKAARVWAKPFGNRAEIVKFLCEEVEDEQTIDSRENT